MPQGEGRFQRLDAVDPDRLNDWIRDKSNITAREWAVARLCADHRTETGIEMTQVGERAPKVVPWIDEPLSASNVGQTRSRIEEKVRRSLTTAMWGLYSGLFDADTFDDILYETTETAKFLLEVEGADLPHDRELEVENALAERMREVGRASREAE